MIQGYKESKSLTLNVKYPNTLMIPLLSFFFHRSQSSFSRSLDPLDTFALISGLKVNYEKTEALWIGSCTCSEITIPSSKPILWAKDKVYALGVWFSTFEDTPAHVSFSEKIDKLQSILNSWSARRLTLLGKITIIKSLAVCHIVYLLSSLPSHQKIVHKINSILYDFPWDSKSGKIKRTEMINDYDKRGTRMIGIQSFNASLKMKWVQCFLNTETKGKWEFFSITTWRDMAENYCSRAIYIKKMYHSGK